MLKTKSNNQFTLIIVGLVYAFLLFGNSFSALAYSPVELNADAIISLVNEARFEEGMNALDSHILLTDAAQIKAEMIAESSDFAHTLKDGTTAWELIENSGYKYQLAGENLAAHFETEESAVEAWLQSPSHRKNIMTSSFEHTGIGISKGELDGVSGYFIVQIFASQRITTAN